MPDYHFARKSINLSIKSNLRRSRRNGFKRAKQKRECVARDVTRMSFSQKS